MSLSQVRMEGLSHSMMCGQVQQVQVHLENTGTHALYKLRVATTHPDFFTFSRDHHGNSADNTTDMTSVYPTKTQPCETDSQEQVVQELEQEPVVEVRLCLNIFVLPIEKPYLI